MTERSDAEPVAIRKARELMQSYTDALGLLDDLTYALQVLSGTIRDRSAPSGFRWPFPVAPLQRVAGVETEVERLMRTAWWSRFTRPL